MGDDESSFNTELASITLEEEVLELELLDRLDSEDICELRKYFFTSDTTVKRKRRPSHKKNARAKEPQEHRFGGQPLTKRQFVRAVGKVVGNTLYSPSASSWFESVNTSKTGRVWWEQLLDHMIEKLGSRCVDGLVNPLRPQIDIVNMPHCKRETIIKVVPIETQATFCYAVVSKFGRVGVYDGRLQLLDSYVIALGEGDVRERIGDADGVGRRRRITSIWLTDAVHLPDASVLLLACSDRSLHMYDSSTLIHAPLFLIKGMEHVPLCLSYTTGSGKNSSMLFIGDSAGNVTTLHFHQPSASLFHKRHPNKLDKYYWVELNQQTDYVNVTVDVGVHGDAVRQLAHFPDNDTVVSCSHDPFATLVIRHVAARKTPYIFRLSRGVRCFHLERCMRLLATGSDDNATRLWNPVVTKQPLVTLFGHKTAVVDVLILRHLRAVVSYSQDGVLKVWDTEDHCCLQTLRISFPSFSVLGKVVEYGTRSLYPGPSSGAALTPSDSEVWLRGQLLVACCDHVALLRVETARKNTTPPPLPPPSREHHASVPSPWTAADARGLITPDLPSSLEESDSRRRSSRSSEITTTLDAQSLRKAASLRGLNMLRVKHERQLEDRRPLVEQCAPHLALQLWDLQDIQFSRDLPLTRRMHDRGLELSDPDKVVHARLPAAAGSSSSKASSTVSSIRSSVGRQLRVTPPRTTRT
ncbi:WD repeat-containing protein on Y chromosome-like isoform X2 [Zootermopsis nevadensis]|uniref:WD repeat-containing protein on Y chromosome-like isoform X2 n=1 Tax=Zootermopsis nevadensis TaxID=136037 RepID=UPI000B8EB731|nr:WD repeat-containing protein on Y chromosome-like isoform X2 [Zootermopsis nevadensis]